MDTLVKTTFSTLESHLWEAANILHSSPADRTDWKSYILPLMFFKRICDVWDEEFEEAVKTYGEYFADEHRFQVPKVIYVACSLARTQHIFCMNNWLPLNWLDFNLKVRPQTG